MVGHKRVKRLRRIEYLRRLIVLMLCLGLILPTFSGLIAYSAPDDGQEEVRERLLHRIRDEGWDPYSESMSIEEFYALMAMFEDGTLPLGSNNAARPAKLNTVARSIMSIMGLNDDETEESGSTPAESPVTIPRNMFMFSGVDTNTNGVNAGKPLEYDNGTNYEPIEGSEGKYDYPAGLDPYGMNYVRPPMEWKGVKVNEESQAVVIVDGINKGNPSIAGNVDQDLFLKYDGRYVRRVTAQNTEATILGAIKLIDQDRYIYYYLTDSKQSNDVSTTTLPEGQKFIVEYLPIEHEIEYKVLKNSSDGIEGEDITNVRESVNIGGTDVRDTWENIIFGAEHPTKTDGGAYSFIGYAPYGYTVEFYLQEKNSAPVLQLGKDKQGAYDAVNDGWALGKEPDYVNGTRNDAHISPSAAGTKKLVMSSAFYNDAVDSNRTVIAVVTKNADPTFLVAPLKHDTNNVSNRGTSALTEVKAKDKTTGEVVTIPYDYEDVYLWTNGKESKYDYSNNGTGGDWGGSNASYDNLKVGNIATADNWQWQNKAPYNTTVKMNREADGTYSYQWTWQTNSTDNYILDTLEINGVGITIPYFAKQAVNDDDKYKGESPGTDGGMKTWYTETDIDHGIHIKVDYLMVFAGRPQRVYRITVTGARSNVNITGMNLMQYGSGADEFSTYKLDGVTGATLKGNGAGDGTHTAAIQYFNDKSAWSENTPQGTVVVKSDNNGINFNGDPALYGANIRFKLADGYDSPYYLWESTKGGVIKGQASIERDKDGKADYSTMRSVRSLSSVGKNEDDKDGNLSSQYIYGPDAEGWYYIRVTTQDDSPQDKHKIALLTIVAREVRYVVRYIPSYDAVKNEPNGGLQRSESSVGIVDNPEYMPFYDHTNDSSHDSFVDSANGHQYDNKEGAYYDTTVDDVAILSTSVPRDPNLSKADVADKYNFVDWVLVDDKFNPVWAWTNGKGDSVQVTTDQYGNRFLITPNEDEEKLHHPALWNADEKTLDIGTAYHLNWNGTAYELIDRNGTVCNVENWVTLTRDGKLAYAKGGTPVDVGEADLTAQLARWGVRDANGDAAIINLSSEFHYRSNHITLIDVNQYAIANEGLGGDQTDVYVLRLMPVWEPIENPFNYKVALNWVDAQGILHEDFFDKLWSPVVTDWDLANGKLTVQVIKDAEPFRDWIAQHPTYAFWDEVNNNNALYKYMMTMPPDANEATQKEYKEKSHEAMKKEMDKAIETYLPALYKEKETNEEMKERYDKVLEALCRRDVSGNKIEGVTPPPDKIGNGQEDFWRLGNYAYQVFEDNGTIVVWMYETKGGLVFHKTVDKEPFAYDDEFYFTVTDVTVGLNEFNRLPLNNTYKAYPEHVYDNNGNERTVTDKDTWQVKFENGEIVNIVKNDGSDWPEPAVTYFTLKDGEGIGLYVPGGKYTISEVGSKSGGSYKAGVTYTAADGSLVNPDLWELPDGDDLWLQGSDKEYIPPTIDDPNNSGNTIPNPAYPDGVSQVTATVQFETGELNVVQTLTFSNQTSSMVIEKEVLGVDDPSRQFTFSAELFLPKGAAPLKGTGKGGTEYYYFNFNLYDVAYGESEVREINKSTGKLNGTAKGSGTGRIVMYKDEAWQAADPDDETTHWVAKGLLFQPEPEDDGSYDWSKVDAVTDIKNISLKHNQRLYVVITVPDQGNISYKVEETDTGPYHVLGGINPKSGHIKPAELAYVLFTNVTHNVIIIENVIEGTMINPDDKFEFTVTLSGDGIEAYLGLLSSLDFSKDNDSASYSAKFILGAGECIILPGLPDGISYTVSDVFAEGYQLKRIDTSSVYAAGQDSGQDSGKTINTDKDNATADGETGRNNYSTDDTIIFVHSIALPDFPETGGIGVMAFCISGALLIAFAALLMLTSKKRA